MKSKKPISDPKATTLSFNLSDSNKENMPQWGHCKSDASVTEIASRPNSCRASSRQKKVTVASKGAKTVTY
ncbi:hypothetical protein CR513_13779, partial [Mucuna pruriens]